MASDFKHQKKRNSGLVYEFLVRQMARQLIERDARGYRETCDIARRYFGRNAYLARELELFDVVRSSRGLPEAAARRVLKEVLSQAARLDRRRLDIEKSNLIKEMNYSLGRDVFTRHRVPEYRLLASLQILFNSSGRGTLRERVESILSLEEAVVRFMMAPAGAPSADAPPQVDRLVLELASKKFQEKYGRALSGDQKKLLEMYVRSMVTGDGSRLSAHTTQQVDRTRAAISRARELTEVREDSVMRERLDEVSGKLDALRGATDGESVRELLLFQRLVEELEDGR